MRVRGGVGGGDGTSVLVELVLRQTVQTDCCTSITCTTLAFVVRLLGAAVTSGHARGYMIGSLTQTRRKRPLCSARECKSWVGQTVLMQAALQHSSIGVVGRAGQLD